MAESDSCFERVPIEIKTKIFHHLNLASKMNARLVCQSWNTIIDFGWRPVTFHADLTNTNLKFVKNSSKIFEKINVRDLTVGLPISSHRNKITCNVEKIALFSGISSTNLNKLLLNSFKLKNLALVYLENEALKTITLLERYWSTNQLTILEMVFDTVDQSQSYLLEQLPSHPFPCLYSLFCIWKPLNKDVQRNIYITEEMAECFFTSYLSIHELIVNCSATVKSVCTNFYSVFQHEGFDITINNPNMVEKHARILHALRKIPLELLEIQSFHQEGGYPWTLSGGMINSERHFLVDIFLYNCELLTASQVALLISNNANTLKHFDIVSNYNAQLVVFDCSWFVGCSKLSSLGIDCFGNDRYIFKVIGIPQLPLSVYTLTIISEWLPSEQDKVWMTTHMLKLYYLCINVDRIFQHDYFMIDRDGDYFVEDIQDEENAENYVVRDDLARNAQDNPQGADTSDIFSVKTFKAFLRLPQLKYLTLIHSKSYNPKSIMDYCDKSKHLEYQESKGNIFFRLYITIH